MSYKEFQPHARFKIVTDRLSQLSRLKKHEMIKNVTWTGKQIIGTAGGFTIVEITEKKSNSEESERLRKKGIYSIRQELSELGYQEEADQILEEDKELE